VRPEINQVRHRLTFRVLCKWPDRATLEEEIDSLRRGLDTGQKTVVEVGVVTCGFRAYYRGRIHAPGTLNGVSQPTYQKLPVTHRDLRVSHSTTSSSRPWFARHVSPFALSRSTCAPFTLSD